MAWRVELIKIPIFVSLRKLPNPLSACGLHWIQSIASFHTTASLQFCSFENSLHSSGTATLPVILKINFTSAQSLWIVKYQVLFNHIMLWIITFTLFPTATYFKCYGMYFQNTGLVTKCIQNWLIDWLIHSFIHFHSFIHWLMLSSFVTYIQPHSDMKQWNKEMM